MRISFDPSVSSGSVVHARPSSSLARRPDREPHWAILRIVRSAGEISLDALVRAIPAEPHPLRAIMTVVDMGLIEMDLRAVFDGSTRLRPTTPV